MAAVFQLWPVYDIFVVHKNIITVFYIIQTIKIFPRKYFATNYVKLAEYWSEFYKIGKNKVFNNVSRETFSTFFKSNNFFV